MYAKTFNFERYVRYRHEILSITQNSDFEETGRWRVKAKNLDNPSQIVDEVFDGVMVCTGHHGTVSVPTFKGQEKFKGDIKHTHSIKTSEGYEDKNVCVVGIGNSGGDAAVEMSVVAKQVSSNQFRNIFFCSNFITFLDRKSIAFYKKTLM